MGTKVAKKSGNAGIEMGERLLGQLFPFFFG